MSSLAKNLSVMQQVARINRELLGVADKCQGPVEQTLITQASLVASEQRALAPVDPESETPGALKDSVRVEQGAPTAKRAFVVKIKAGGALTLKSGAGGKAYDYARAVVFGTVNAPAFDFFFAPWRARRKDAHAAVRSAIKRAVSKVFQ